MGQHGAALDRFRTKMYNDGMSRQETEDFMDIVELEYVYKKALEDRLMRPSDRTINTESHLFGHIRGLGSEFQLEIMRWRHDVYVNVRVRDHDRHGIL